jgi:hypothetical protein
MGHCIHNSFNGTCTYYVEGEKDENLGVSVEGFCICEDDEYPLDSCTYFETDEDEDEEEFEKDEESVEAFFHK